MRKFDYLIVGQGIAGSLLAWKLIKAGRKVLVINNDDHISASSVAAGMYNPLVFKRITKSWMVDSLFPCMKKFYSELENEMNHQFVYPMDIIKPINEEEFGKWHKKLVNNDLSSYIKGIDKNITVNGIKKDFGFARITGSGRVDINSICISVRKNLQKSDSIITEDFKYADLKITNETVIWKDIEASKVVFCEGAYGIKNPYFSEVQFKLTKGDVILIKADLTDEFIFNKQVFIMPVGNGLFLSGSTYKWNDLELTQNEEDKEYLIDRLKGLLDVSFVVVNHRSGIRPTVNDRRPVLGQHNQYKQLYYFNGLGTKGVMLAPYFSEQMIGLLENAKSVDSEVSIRRFEK